MELSIQVFKLSSSLPRSEDYGFTPLGPAKVKMNCKWQIK